MGAMQEWVKTIYKDVFYYNESYREGITMKNNSCTLCKLVDRKKHGAFYWRDEDWLMTDSFLYKNTPMLIYKNHVPFPKGARYSEDIDGLLEALFINHAGLDDYELRYADIGTNNHGGHFHAHYIKF